MRHILYTVLIVSGFAFMEWRGVNLLPVGSSSRVPASMRNTSGYRSYMIFHGGK